MREHLQPSYGCAVELALDVIGGKWKVVILAHLKQGPLRYSELRARMPRVSEKMLSQRLRELRAMGLVDRRPSPEDGFRYALTNEGARLGPALTALHAWGSDVARREDVDLQF